MESSELHNEKQVLLDLSQGCEQAFEKVYKFYSPRLYYKLLRILKSEPVVEEVLQDVFLIIWKNRHYINTEKSFCSYIFCIASSKAYDFFRRSIRDRKLLDQLARTAQRQCASAEADLLKREASGSVHQAIAMLPPKRRQVFMLCKVDGKSYEEVSNQLGISPSTISDHIVKANLFLKNYLTEADA
jgi:RNA polymerase sigma-70 factor (ECF subfamily)